MDKNVSYNLSEQIVLVLPSIKKMFWLFCLANAVGGILSEEDAENRYATFKLFTEKLLNDTENCEEALAVFAEFEQINSGLGIGGEVLH